jgi:hypothetical protein
MIDTETRPFGEYGFAIRRFWVKCTDLTVSRRWERHPLSDPDAAARFSISITGKAISVKDSVCVIGEEDRQTKVFDLILKSDADAKQEWERIRDIAELLVPHDRTTPGMRVRGSSFDRLNKNPPTAALLAPFDDQESGGQSEWSIECAIPPSVLAQFEAELLAQRVHELYLGIEWEAGLVRDEHAPASLPTSWGLFTIGEGQTPEPLHGYVKLIRWNVSNDPETFDQAIKQEQQPPPQRNLEEEVDRLGKTLAGYMLALTRICIIGFFAAITLILVSYFLR